MVLCDICTTTLTHWRSRLGGCRNNRCHCQLSLRVAVVVISRSISNVTADFGVNCASALGPLARLVGLDTLLSAVNPPFVSLAKYYALHHHLQWADTVTVNLDLDARIFYAALTIYLSQSSLLQLYTHRMPCPKQASSVQKGEGSNGFTVNCKLTIEVLLGSAVTQLQVETGNHREGSHDVSTAQAGLLSGDLIISTDAILCRSTIYQKQLSELISQIVLDADGSMIVTELDLWLPLQAATPSCMFNDSFRLRACMWYSL
jgi:hypothetical protein